MLDNVQNARGQNMTDAEKYKRYYYDDPIAAAWMAKHFGMKFTRPCKAAEGEFEEDFSDWYGCGLSEAMYADGFGKFYVHPESLHILEPKINDGFYDAAGNCGWGAIGEVCGDPGKNDRLAESQRSMNIYALSYIIRKMKDKNNSISIIQRNNIPFMWPKEEIND